MADVGRRCYSLLGLVGVSCVTQVEHRPIVAYHEHRPPPEFIEAPDALEPEQPRAEMLLQCAEDSVEEFNASDLAGAPPLRRAISCFDAIGFWVNATKVQKVLNEEFPEHGNPDRYVHFKGKAFDVMERPSAARQTVWGQYCLDKRGRTPEVTTALRVECAQKAAFTAWVVELCGPPEARGRLDGHTQDTCSRFDGFLKRLEETAGDPER